jgi:multidrug efflux pump subunit AcrA (membrane-fusion protein)
VSSQQVTVPDIGDLDTVPVIEILVAVGDEVNVEDPLVTLESDKATMDVPAPAAGTVEKLEDLDRRSGLAGLAADDARGQRRRSGARVHGFA